MLGVLLTFEATAQDNSAKPKKVKLGKTKLMVHPDAIYMLKLEDKTIEIDLKVLEEIDLSWVVLAESITGEKALVDYGDKGEFGVVLLTFTKEYEPEVLRIMQDAKRKRL